MDHQMRLQLICGLVATYNLRKALNTYILICPATTASLQKFPARMQIVESYTLKIFSKSFSKFATSTWHRQRVIFLFYYLFGFCAVGNCSFMTDWYMIVLGCFFLPFLFSLTLVSIVRRW